MTTEPSPFRLIPAIDKLMRLQGDVAPALAREAARILVGRLRQRMQSNWPPPDGGDAALGDAALEAELGVLRADLGRPFHRRVINATGILLHTGLGRAPLPDVAIDAIRRVAGQGYVEVLPETGLRGRRETRIAEHLCALTGAEAAMVVNNNAGATLLALDAMARGGDAILSRGELVEIGGGFRMPAVMNQAGCRLVEVGATNRTKPQDYEAAIGTETRCLLKVHPSNYRIEGFTEEVALPELVAIGARHGVPVVEDLGSGLMLDERLPHDAREPSVLTSVRAGADLICFSGDKLFGSYQAGILVGKRDCIERVSRHPLYRALRMSKIGLAALEATLLVYRFGEPKREIPILRAIWTPQDQLEARADALREALAPHATALGYAVASVPSHAFLGSGASPARALDSFSVALSERSGASSVWGLEQLARRLRLAAPAVFPRIEDARLLLDLRSIAPGEELEIEQVFAGIDPAGPQEDGWRSGRRTND